MGADRGIIPSMITDEVSLRNQDGEKKNDVNNTPNHVIISIIFNEGESIIEFLFLTDDLYATSVVSMKEGDYQSEDIHSGSQGRGNSPARGMRKD